MRTLLNLLLGPFPNEHAARLQQPGRFDPKTYRRTKDGTLFGSIKVPMTVSVIWAKLKGKAKPSDPPLAQSLRFPTKSWTVAQARKWLKDNKIKVKLFEPAKKPAAADARIPLRADSRGQVVRATRNPAALAKAHGAFSIAGSPVEWIEAGGDAGEDEKPKKFKMNLYNGGAMRIRGFYLPLVVDIAGLTAQRQIATLLNHDPDQVGGHAEPDMTKRRLNLKNGVMSGDDKTVERITSMAVKGFPWRGSLGVSPGTMEMVDEDETAKANGRTFKGPLLIARTGELGEGSFVPVGADQSTSATVAASGAVRGGEAMEFDKWLKAQGIDKDNADTKTITAMKKLWLAQGSPEGDPVDPPADPAPADPPPADPPTPAPDAPPADPAVPEATAKLIEAGIAKGVEKATGIMAAEQVRLGAVQSVVDRFAGQLGATKAAQIKGEAMANADGKWTPDHTELTCMRAARVEGAVGIITGNAADAPDAAHVFSAALSMNAGVVADKINPLRPSEVEAGVLLTKQQREGIMNAAMAGNQRNVGLHDAMRFCVEMSGQHWPTGRVSDRHIRLALAVGIRGAGTTFSLSGLMAATQRDTLLQAFTSVDPVSTRVSRKGNLKDFNTHTTYRLVGTGRPEEVPASGTLKQLVTFDEDSYTNQLITRGTMLNIGRAQLINDSLGVFQQSAGILGHTYAEQREFLFFTLFNSSADGAIHFKTANGNYVTGATSVMSLGGLDIVGTAFKKMKHVKSGKFINQLPHVVLVPSDVAYTAKSLVTPTMDLLVATGVGNAASRTPAQNHWANKLTGGVEESPYMSDSSITGYSATAWAMLANPAVVPMIEIGYLNGIDTPTIQAVASAPETLGVSTQSFWDVGVAFAEIYCGQKAKGA